VTLDLQLKVIWQKQFLGIAIDQGNKTMTLPITSYYFWPRTDAWKQLQLELESKSWISPTEKVKVLNLATDVIASWQDDHTQELSASLKEKLSKAKFSSYINIGL
jgi:30S ribosomal protein 3